MEWPFTLWLNLANSPPNSGDQSFPALNKLRHQDSGNRSVAWVTLTDCFLSNLFCSSAL